MKKKRSKHWSDKLSEIGACAETVNSMRKFKTPSSWWKTLDYNDAQMAIWWFGRSIYGNIEGVSEMWSNAIQKSRGDVKIFKAAIDTKFIIRKLKIKWTSVHSERRPLHRAVRKAAPHLERMAER